MSRHLLGAALGDPQPWSAWFVILKAAFGQPLYPSERRLFARLAGGRKPPRGRVAELWVIAGRRSGKKPTQGGHAKRPRRRPA